MIAATEERVKKAIKKTDKKINALERDMIHEIESASRHGRKKGSIKSSSYKDDDEGDAKRRKSKKKSKTQSPDESNDSSDDKIDEASDEGSVSSPVKSNSGESSADSDSAQENIKVEREEIDNYSKESSVQIVDLSNYYTREEVGKLIDEKIATNHIEVKADITE